MSRSWSILLVVASASSCSLVIDLPMIPHPFCGDGIVEEGEECDDGNAVAGDGCNPPCTLPAEHIINTSFRGGQGNPSVALFSTGASVVVFDDESSQPPDLDDAAVRARFFDALGEPTGADFVLPERPAGKQEHGDAAAGAVALLVWQDSSGYEDPDKGVRARAVSSSGEGLGPDFQVNATVIDDQRDPAVAVLPDGRFLVVWLEVEVPNAVRGRIVGADGATLGDELAISPAGAQPLGKPAVAAASDRFLVAWPDGVAADSDVRARFVSPDKTLGETFTVNTTLRGAQAEPALGFDAATDRFLIAWTDASSVEDADSTGIRARLLTGPASFLGDDFQLNQAFEGTQETPSVATATSGVFLAVWTGIDDSGTGVRSRRVATDGQLLDEDALINTVTTGDQKDADVAQGPAGFFVVWEDESAVAPDTDQDAVRGLMLPVRGAP